MRACNLKIFIYYKMLIVEMQSNKDQKKKKGLKKQNMQFLSMKQNDLVGKTTLVKQGHLALKMVRLNQIHGNLIVFFCCCCFPLYSQIYAPINSSLW